MSDIPAQKRGRKPGSSDSIFLTLAQLNTMFRDTTVIPVRRTWLAKIQAMPTALPPSQDGDALPPNLQDEDENQKIQFQISND